MPIQQAPEGMETFPQILRDHAKVRPNKVAYREKEYGIWQSYSWSDVNDHVRALALGLHTRGVKRGDRIAIIGNNRPRLYWSMAAAQALGAVPVPMYQDAVAKDIGYVLEHAEIAAVIAENQEQVDKVLEVHEQCPTIGTVVYCDTKGLRNYDVPFLFSFADMQDKGREFASANPDFLDSEIDSGKADDVAILPYTSGTTGAPKGVVLSHNNILCTSFNANEFEGLTEDEEILAYLPMAWIGDHIFSYGQAMVAGFAVNCPESTETILTDLREIGPTYYFAPPRVFENLLTTVMVRMEDASKLKRGIFNHFLGVAKRVGADILEGRAVSLGDKFQYALGNLLVYGPLKDTLGLRRVRLAYTAGEAIGPEIFDFYRSLGVNLKQLYGSTEASVYVTIQPNGEIRSDTVGPPAPGTEVKIADNGEVLFRSPGVFVEYFKNPKATKETKTKDGWVLTGDAGFFDDDGHLHIIDRAKDVGKLKDGSLFAPKYIENKLKFFPNVKEVVVFGADKDNVTAFINLDLQAVGSWAERNNIAYASYQELTSIPQIEELIKGNVEQVNADLANDPNVSSSQVTRFILLPKELDADDGELTQTRKVRRRIVAERYDGLIQALYSKKTEAHMKAEVTFEDGRKGFLEADVKIVDAQTFEPQKKAA
jgi:long-chain acyl-CoA synthetase